MTNDLQKQLAEVKAKKLELLEQARKFQENHKLESFKPHPKQQIFLDALADETIRTFIVCGGNRSGKTEISMVSAISLALGRFPWFPKPTPVVIPDNFPWVKESNGFRAWVIKTTVSEEAVKVLMNDGWEPTSYQESKGVRGKPALTKLFNGKVELNQYVRRMANPEDPYKLRFNPPVKIRILGEDMTALEKVQIPKLKKYVAPEWVAAKKKNSFGVENHWVFTNGSTFELLTYQQDSAMMEGWDGHVAIYDEPPPRSHYIANQRGLLDHNGISIFSMTPLKEPWIADEIVNKPDPTIWAITIGTTENPHLSAKAIEEFESKLTEDEKKTRIGGEFLHLQGLVFKDFNKQTHLKNCRDIEPDCTVYASIDTHPRTEQAIVFLKVDKRGNMFVVKEHFRHGSPDYVADQIIGFHKHEHKIEMVLIEPASKGDTNRGQSTFEIIEGRLAEHGIQLECGSKDLSGGILQMQDAFMSRNKVASLFIDPSCERLIWELSRYIWKDWKTGGSSDKGELNKPQDKDDHLIECTRRLIQLPAEYVAPRQAEEFIRNNKWNPADPEIGY